MVKTEKITGAIKNEPIKVKKPEPPKTSKDMFKLHFLSAFIGNRNSGKTNSAILLSKKLQDEKSIDRIFIISPTYHNNPIFSVLNIDEDDIYTDLENVFGALDEIQDKVHLEKQSYDDYHDYKKIIEKLIIKGENALTFREISLLELNDYKLPFNKYGGKKPGLLLIIDDASHSKIFKSGRNPFINLALRHRHLHSIGISIMLLVQNWVGITKTIRQNLNLIFLYKTHDETQLDDVYKQLLANQMKKEQFIELYDHATKDDHHFLTIDLDAKNKNKKFRKDFDEYLII